MKRSEIKRKTPLKNKSNTPRARSGLKRGPYRPKQEGKTITCAREGCDKTVFRRASELRKGAKFCSRGCWTLAVREEKARDEARQRGRKIMADKDRTGVKNPNYRHGERLGERAGKRVFQSGQETCQHPHCPRRGFLHHEHHVVYAQHVRKEGGDEWDPRNALRLCHGCHSSHHRRGTRVVPVSALRDENIAFAVELFGGPRAYAYFTRYYVGADPRIDGLA